MKKQYTKKQIREAISYWEKQLAEGNYRKVNENEEGEFDPEYFQIGLKDRVTSDKTLLMLLKDAYKRLEPDWNMDMNDEDYLNWEYDFMSWITDRAERNGGDMAAAVDDMRQALYGIIRTGNNYDA